MDARALLGIARLQPIATVTGQPPTVLNVEGDDEVMATRPSGSPESVETFVMRILFRSRFSLAL
jgi:hypothetical protein